MATIKNCTDIPQSKKLAEILPLESADMHWQDASKEYENPYGIYDGCFRLVAGNSSKIINNKRDFRKGFVLPAWSLAALLGVLRIYTTPTAFSINISVPSLTKTKDGYSITYVGDYRIMESNNNDVESPIEIVADNPIDACYELILKLHELNLL